MQSTEGYSSARIQEESVSLMLPTFTMVSGVGYDAARDSGLMWGQRHLCWPYAEPQLSQEMIPFQGDATRVGSASDTFLQHQTQPFAKHSIFSRYVEPREIVKNFTSLDVFLV